MKETAAHEFGFNARRNWKWCNQKDKFISLKKKGQSKHRWLDEGGQKVMDKELEEALLSWAQQLRSGNL